MIALMASRSVVMVKTACQAWLSSVDDGPVPVLTSVNIPPARVATARRIGAGA